MIRKGDIYIANLGKNAAHNMAKQRPVIVFQNDRLNRAVDESYYQDVVVIPLSAKIVPGSYRVTLPPREKLLRPSDAICNALCTISFGSIDRNTGPIARLSAEEITQIETILLDLFGIGFS